MFKDIIFNNDNDKKIELGIMVENIVVECEPLFYKLHKLHGEVGVEILLDMINEQIKMRVDKRIQEKFGDEIITDGESG